MASDKTRPTPPPSGPALVRPAVGALLLSLSLACGDDDGGTSTDTVNDSMDAAEGPMPAPTTVAPMIPPSTTSTTGPDDSSDVGPMPPPMPDPTDTEGATGTTTSGGDSTGSTTDPPPMPPPGSTSE